MLLEIVGLTLAFIEIYRPSLADSWEAGLDWFRSAPLNWQKERRQDYINLRRILRWFYPIGVILIGYLGAQINLFAGMTICEWVGNPDKGWCVALSGISFNLVFGLLVCVFLGAVLSAIGLVIIVAVAKLLAAVIWGVDRLGRGHGLGGFGLALAMIGLLQRIL